MIYDLSNPYDEEKFIKAVDKLKEKGAVVELKERKLKTRAQNNYLHLILAKFALETGYTIDEIKYKYFKNEVNRDIFIRTKINPRGKEIQYTRSTSELTKEETTTAIERFRNWSASYANIYLPSADEHRLLMFVEAELQRQRQYL